MIHLKKFNENFNSDSDYKSLIGSKSISIGIENNTFILKTDNGNLNICCSGSNQIDYSLSFHSNGDVTGLVISKIQRVDEYESYILFDNGLSINVFDDSGGEGIEMWVS